MKALFLSALLILPTIAAFPQTKAISGVTIKSDQKAVVTATKNGKNTKIDLAEDVAGCSYIDDGDYKRSLERNGSAASPATFELIDVTEKNDQTYLIIFSKAFGNCNINGRCGASGAHSLIWVHLDSQFKLVEKSAVSVELCTEDIILVSPEWTDGGKTDSFFGRRIKFPFKNNVLTVQYEKSIYGDDQKFEYELFTLVYDKNNPDKGFEVKSKVSPDSILDDNP